MSIKALFLVLPILSQPGKSGTFTPYPTLAAFSIIIAYLTKKQFTAKIKIIYSIALASKYFSLIQVSNHLITDKPALLPNRLLQHV